MLQETVSAGNFVEEFINEDLENKTQNSEEYLEQQARENGMARPGEQIYQEIPGD